MPTRIEWCDETINPLGHWCFGPGAKQHQPSREWIDDICAQADKWKIPVFMKDSLIPIVGAENMRRELPWELHT
jgi:hypothetical protein